MDVSPEKIEETRRQLIQQLEIKARNSLLQVINEVLGVGDLIMLSALNVDGRQKMLDVFIEQCQLLKKEMSDDV